MFNTIGVYLARTYADTLIRPHALRRGRANQNPLLFQLLPQSVPEFHCVWRVSVETNRFRAHGDISTVYCLNFSFP